MMILTSCSGGLTDLDREGLKGEVKSIVERQYKAVFKDGHWVAGNPSFYGHSVINYTSEGFYLESIALNENGDTTGFTKTRRVDGEMVEEVFHSRLEDRSSKTMLERVSDEEVHFEMWEGENLYYEGANYFDSKGRIERQIRVVNDLEVINYYIYEKNLLVENYQEDLSGQRTFTQRYDYEAFDEPGNWTFKLVYVGDEKIVPDFVIKREYTYHQ